MVSGVVYCSCLRLRIFGEHDRCLQIADYSDPYNCSAFGCFYVANSCANWLHTEHLPAMRNQNEHRNSSD